jgi:hypothetical protein
LKQKRGGEKVRIHGHDCTTTREKTFRWYLVGN